MKQHYKGKKVAILGISVEGIDSVKFFAARGAYILCADRRSEKELGDTYGLLKNYPVSFQLGPTYLDHLEDYDVLVRTPGMSPRLSQLIALTKKGKQLTSLTRIFFDECQASIIGVTGTKGKGTTSTLIAKMLEASGKKVYFGGNVGTPLLSGVDSIQKNDLVVLELSSFQLEDLNKSPHIAVVLKTTQDHIANFDPLATNAHENREAYVEAKKSIVRYQSAKDWVIVNADDATSSSFASLTPARRLMFSRQKDTDAFVKDHAVYLKDSGQLEQICKASEIILRGDHNLENIAAATLAARVGGATINAIREVAKSFEGLEHRLEFVRTLDNVSYFNDSFSTVPETTIAAIQSFVEPIILIVGGSEKGSDFSEMGKVIATSTVKVLIVIGTMTDRIVQAVKKSGFTGKIITGLTSMHRVVKTAREQSTKGDVVILSPGCASFDMFVNYKERGKQFKHETSLLAA